LLSIDDPCSKLPSACGGSDREEVVISLTRSLLRFKPSCKETWLASFKNNALVFYDFLGLLNVHGF
jgi:hypothetical protein